MHLFILVLIFEIYFQLKCVFHHEHLVLTLVNTLQDFTILVRNIVLFKMMAGALNPRRSHSIILCEPQRGVAHNGGSLNDAFKLSERHNEEAPAAFLTLRCLFGRAGHPADINPLPPSCASIGVCCARAESSGG